MNRHFFVYVTANDVTFLQDYVNLYLTRKHAPGVPMLEVYVVVSEARKVTRLQRIMLRVMMNMLDHSDHIRSRALIMKDNTGWDFSSACAALKQMEGEAEESDFILIRNRSTRGPAGAGWYRNYTDVLESSDRLALVGSSIGFKDHPKRRRVHDIIHVQTYVYASRWRYLSALLPAFPGIDANNHLEAVYNGEIELSQQVMRRGWSIASLQYPGLEIDKENQNQYLDYAGTHPPLSANRGPIVKRPRERSWKDYIQILPILITMIWYCIPVKQQYEIVSAGRNADDTNRKHR